VLTQGAVRTMSVRVPDEVDQDSPADAEAGFEGQWRPGVC
jgi:hypothetical protein